MPEYVEKNELLEIAEQQGHVTVDDIINATSADVAPVIRAHWIWPKNNLGLPKCSNCGSTSHDALWDSKRKCCPACGARMEGTK